MTERDRPLTRLFQVFLCFYVRAMIQPEAIATIPFSDVRQRSKKQAVSSQPSVMQLTRWASMGGTTADRKVSHLLWVMPPPQAEATPRQGCVVEARRGTPGRARSAQRGVTSMSQI